MKTKTLLSIAALTLFFSAQAQNVITVDNSVDANAQYDNLQDAIDAANSGDTIYVQPSETDYGNVTIDKSLTLIGYGHSNTLKNTLIEGIVLEDNASSSRFSGIYVFDEIECENSITLIQDLVFENCRIDEFDFGNLTFYQGVNDVLIRGCVTRVISGYATDMIITNNVIDTGNIGIYIGGNYNSVTIRNNIFYRGNSGSQIPIINSGNASGSITLQNCVFYDNRNNTTDNNSAGVIFENCLTYNQGSGGVDLLIGTNNLDNINPLFVDIDNIAFEASDDYNLQAGSPAIGAGALGVDIGLYDNQGFLFNNFGFTAGVPSVNITAITDQVAPGGMVEVTIESSSN